MGVHRRWLKALLWAAVALLQCWEQPLFALAEQMVVNTYIRIDSAQATSFFPSIGQGGHREFSPEKALSRGSGYWCSEGNHGKQDVVSWTGRIKTRRLVEGIEINWAYAPGKAQFHQVLTFPHAVYLKAIRIMMKDPQSQYFGISLVQLLGGGFPVLRIQSGITSPHQDLCVQSDERGDIVLDGCLMSTAIADERALWQFTEQVLGVCMVLKDNNVQDGGQVVTGDCTAEYNFQDGRSVWELQPNNQLKLLRGGNYCLSQTGSKAGSTDVAKDAEVRSTHSRAADDEHGPSAAVDGNADTFWASPEFPKDAVPEFVHFDVDLGDKYKLRTTDIDWEFPPLSYTIALSNDGANYVDVSRTDVNAAYTTMDDMKAVIARFLRVRMERAHPILGVSNDKLVYGIKTLSVYSNRLRSIVEPCSKAKASSDARDKFFLELVSEVDLSAGMELQRAGKAANALSMSMAKSLSAVDEIMQPAKTCLGAKKAETIKLATIETEIADTMSAIARFDSELQSPSGDVDLSSLPGLTQQHAIEDCYALKSASNKSTSGFYWVLPLCASKPLRAYCDLSSGGTYVTIPDNDGIVTVRDAVSACSKLGLEPVHLKSNRQIEALQRMLDIMEMDLTNPVPVAVNNGANVFYSLDFKKDVTEFIVEAQKNGGLIGNTVGISPTGLIFFDASNTDMSTIICSTNTDAWNPPQSYTDVTCTTAVQGNALFDGPQGSTFFIRCPEGCIHYVDEAKLVGGETGVYTDDSSICIAAIHSGLLSRGGDVAIRIVAAPHEFEGSEKNGVVSSSLLGVQRERAFTLESAARQCPTEKSPSTSFLELHASPLEAAAPTSAAPQHLPNSPTAAPNTTGTNIGIASSALPTAGPSAAAAAPTTAQSGPSPPHPPGASEELNEATTLAVNQLSTILSQQLGGFDSEVMDHVRLSATKAISGTRATLKPAELVETRLELTSKGTLTQIEHLEEHLKNLSGKISQALEKSTKEVKEALQKRAEQSAADEWNIDIVKNAEKSDVFHTFESKLAVGNSKWKIGPPPAGKRENHHSLCQLSAVSPTIPGSTGTGTYAILKDKNYYDFVLSGDILVSGSGSVGIAFRQANGGTKRLLRVVNGVPTEAARIDDGGFVEGQWYHVEIIAQLQRIQIRVSEVSEEASVEAPETDIDLLDGSFMSGSVGFYTSTVNSACFDRLSIKPLPCIGGNDKPLLPPYPPQCSNYRESFVGRISDEWTAFDPEAADVPSHWKYAMDIGGEHATIAQMSNIGGIKNKAPAILALARHRSCDEGQFSFKFFPQCEGIVGAAFNIQDKDNFILFEMGPSFVRLRKKFRGVYSTLTKSNLWSFKPGSWNTIKVSFNSSHIVINAGNATALPVFSIGRTDGLSSGTVGLSTWSCAGVAFSSISLHPANENAVAPVVPAQDLPAFEQITSLPIGLDRCIGLESLAASLKECSSGNNSGESGFCDTCCSTEFANSRKAEESCRRHCKEKSKAAGALACVELVKMKETCVGGR
ncbi:uncharacterized protein LOC34617422 [Cyclospora cayetanensis]|uniref:Uncharacterized protein LOC34617422 n=1 Tax=Cyclospora cayetanensis TaxID=88456 RepID=A0A6P6RUU5_9EIME|nr:uncharacterized protein LOC34617422 [Cyclospora cayetanensis]